MLGFNSERVRREARCRQSNGASGLLRRSGIVASLALSVGCSSWSSPPDHQEDSAVLEGPMFQTDSATYHLTITPTARRLRITASFTNTGASPVYLVLCGSSALVRLEKHAGDGWQVAYEPLCSMDAAAPIEVRPGTTYRDSATVLDMIAPNSDPKFMVSPIEGTYRAIYSGFSSWNPSSSEGPPGEVLPEDVRRSNEFIIVQ